MDKAKHIHHYVPRRYLRAWSRNGDGVIAVKFGDRPARLVSVDGIAFEDGGYSYKPLTPEMLRSILCCRPRSNRVTDTVMRAFFLPTIVVPVFYRALEDPSNNDVITMWRMIQESNLVDERGQRDLESLRQAYFCDRDQFRSAMHDHQKEGYENILCKIENDAWPILDSMIKGELGWLKNEKLSFHMFYYICSQRTRSPSFMKMTSRMYKSTSVSSDFAAGALYRRHILALDSAAILLSLRHGWTFRVIKSDEESEFISGDLPVITVRADDNSRDYYFPLSPTRAFIFGPCKNFDKRNAELLKGEAASVQILNRAIKRDSTLQVYGSTESILNEF